MHLQVVSQLHALDGSTTYGLPYDKLMPPAVSSYSREATARGSLVVFDDSVVVDAICLWIYHLRLGQEQGPETVWPPTGTPMPRLCPRAVLDMLLRAARAAVRSWEHCHGRHAAPAARSSSVPCATTPQPQPQPLVSRVAVFHAPRCARVALTALGCAADHMMRLHPRSASQPYGSGAGSSSGGAGGSGSGGRTEARRSGSTTCGADVSGGGGGGSEAASEWGSGSNAGRRMGVAAGEPGGGAWGSADVSIKGDAESGGASGGGGRVGGGGGGGGRGGGVADGATCEGGGSCGGSGSAGRGAGQEVAGGGSSDTGERIDLWLVWMRRRRFATEWWRLVVAAVHMGLEWQDAAADVGAVQIRGDEYGSEEHRHDDEGLAVEAPHIVALSGAALGNAVQACEYCLGSSPAAAGGAGWGRKLCNPIVYCCYVTRHVCVPVRHAVGF